MGGNTNTHLRLAHLLELVGDSLSELSLEGGGDVGDGGEHEGGGVDVDSLALLDAGESDSTDDDKEHGIGKRRLDVNGGDEETDDGREDGLAGLHDLRETDGAGSHGENGATMGGSGAEADGDARNDVRAGEVGGLADSAGPQEEGPHDAEGVLGGGDELWFGGGVRSGSKRRTSLRFVSHPVRVHGVGRLLVVDVVQCVAGVPGGNQENLGGLGGRGGLAGRAEEGLERARDCSGWILASHRKR